MVHLRLMEARARLHKSELSLSQAKTRLWTSIQNCHKIRHVSGCNVSRETIHLFQFDDDLYFVGLYIYYREK